MAPETGAQTPPSADEQVEVMRERLADARRETRLSLTQLETEIREEFVTLTDWRTLYAVRPAYFVGAAFMVGFFLGNRR